MSRAKIPFTLKFLFVLLLPIAVGIIVFFPWGHPTPVFVNFSDLCQEKYYGHWITTEGHLNLPEMSFHYDITSGRHGYVQLDLREEKYSSKYYGILLEIPSKGKKNSAEPLPSRYSAKDLKAYSYSGNILRYNDKVRITGKLHRGQRGCLIRVEKIEGI